MAEGGREKIRVRVRETQISTREKRRGGVRSEEDGFRGSWHPGTVIACYDQGRCVKYDPLLCTDGSDNLEEAVQVSPLLDGIGSANANSCHYRGCIRPLPPHFEFNNKGVGVYYLDAWWEGVIFDHDYGSDERRIFFPDLGDELKTGLDMLRITQDWSEITKNWQPRGTWLFLELIDEYEQAGYLGVSGKQFWYDLRGQKGFKEIKEWTCTRRDLWKELMLEVIDENLNIILKDVLQFLDHSGGLSQEPSGQLESARTAADTSPEATLVNSHAIFPIENDLSADSLAGQEKSVVRELIFPLDANGSDTNISAHSGVPCHNKAACLAAKPLSVLPSNPDGNSGTSSVTVGEEISCTNSDKTNRKPKHMTCGKTGNWLPVGPDIVPGDIFFPNADSDYAHLTMNNRKPGNLLTTNVRKHLSYLGWKIEIMRGKTINRLRYMSPDGKAYHSLRQVCKVRKVSTSEMIFSISDNYPSLHISPNDTSSFSLLRQPEENRDPDFCPQTVVSPQSDELREKPECCPQALVDYDMHGLHKSSKTPTSSLKDSLPKIKRKKGSGPLPNLRGDPESSHPTCMLLSSKRVQQVVAPKSSHHNPRTVLLWLIDNNVVLPRAKVRYCSRKNFHSMAEGRITRHGIKCSCCEKVFTLSNFEVHAGSNYHRPAASIFLEDGRSLFDCQMQVIRGKKMGSYARKPRALNKGTSHQGENDNICTVCHYGGELVLCDKCPSAFHQGCINLKDRIIGVKAEILLGLQKILGKPLPAGEDNLTWTLLKPMTPDTHEVEALSENHSKLNVALEVMHEHFEPIKESRAQRDLVEDVIFNRG
ncbi:hypothetical protein CJ030_MR1G008848 [Morella rubra]|uniref:Uncharacterized protein n=1 Tax=Morella rubra TaxID=262757 RepID=A0A6A1WMB5_9ROSI|nr:hypothetical protein CJ030_MR1G008848 [Morella rubra]